MSQWDQMEALFHDALKLAAGEREAHVRSVCTDVGMCEQVLAMLRQARTGVPTGISNAVVGAAHRTQGGIGSSALQPNDVVGRFRVLTHIADGGMGSVYAGERADGQYQQRVAIKSLQGRFASGATRGHFLAERQFLATLDHPNIARLLDGGVDQHGVPYLVMEFVEGVPLDQYCREQAVSLAQRLALFQKICQAVQVAHNNLIVHRDIKPSNILVTREGEPKLLDFGIAKLLDDPSSEGGQLTEAGDRMMTPDYAAPEQILGQRITTAADVYSLGVVLYELLSGRSPYSRWATAPLELLNAIANTEPERPSAVTDSEAIGRLPPQVAASWKRKLRGDLDHIVLKAMRKEPLRRFHSPAEMADDIERFLQGQPVEARNGNWRYRAGKYLRRNALPVGAAAVMTLGIVALVSFYTFRLQAERDNADEQRLAAEQVSGFMVELFKAANTNVNRPDVLARDVLDAGAARVQTALASQPLMQARLLMAIGESYGGIRLNVPAEALLREAVKLMRENLPADDPRLAQAMTVLGSSLIEPGHHDEAEALHREALAIYRKHSGRSNLRVAKTLASIEQIIAQSRHDADRARYDNLEEALRIFRLHGLENSEDYIAALGTQASWLRQHFDWDASARKWVEAMERAEQAYGPDDIRASFMYENLGRHHYFSGQYAAARPLFKRTIAVVADFKGASHLDMDWSLYFLGRIERESGHAQKARALLERVVAQEDATPQTADDRYLARALCGHALALADAGEFDLAQAQCQRGRDILVQTLDTQKRVQMDVIHEGLGIVALARGDVGTAVRELGAMATLLRAEFDPGQTDTPLAIALHASALAAAGESAQAEALFAESIALAETRYSPDYPTIGRALWARAFLRDRSGDAAGASADRARAQRIFRESGIVPQTEAWTLPARPQRGD